MWLIWRDTWAVSSKHCLCECICASLAAGRVAWTPALCSASAVLLEFPSFGLIALSEHSEANIAATQTCLLNYCLVASFSATRDCIFCLLVMSHISYGYHFTMYMIWNILEMNVLYQYFQELLKTSKITVRKSVVHRLKCGRKELKEVWTICLFLSHTCYMKRWRICRFQNGNRSNSICS